MVRSIRRSTCVLLGILAVVAWPARAAEAKEPHPVVQLAKKMNQTVDFPVIDDPKATLHEVLDKLAQRYNLSFDINDKAFKFENIQDVDKTEVATPNPIPKMHTTLSKVLGKILARIPVPSGATYVLRRDGVEITTGAFRHAEFYRHVIQPIQPINPLDDAALEGIEDFFKEFPLVQVEFDKRPLGEALQELADATDWNVILDPRAAEKAKPVTLTLINVPGDTAVEYLADMADLVVVMRDRSLYVTTRENAARRPFSQTDSPTTLQPGGFGGGKGFQGGIGGAQGGLGGLQGIRAGNTLPVSGQSPPPSTPKPPAAPATAMPSPPDLAKMQTEIASLQAEVAKLQAEVAGLQPKKSEPIQEKRGGPESKNTPKPDPANRAPESALTKPRHRASRNG